MAGPKALRGIKRDRVGHFRVEEKLGTGGVGEVYLGFDERLERRVALKVLHPESADDGAARSRFRREARLLSQLRHPNICQVYDLLEEDGADWLVLEYIEGQTLREAAPDLSHERKLEVASEVVAAVAAAHREGIVHRDLKPENIMLHVDGSVKVLDFGLAHSLQDMTPGLRWSGTLLYMSPEQASRGEIRRPSDLFSLGLVLQELLTGRPAYPALPFHELVERVAAGDTLPPEGVDAELGSLLGRLLTVDPEERPTADETLEALAAGRDKPARRRRRRRLWAAGAVALTVVMGALLSAWSHRRQLAEQARLTQQFTREVDDMEWTLRSAYLGPVQDLRPLHRQVRERMDALRRRMDEVGEVGRGPGEFALGRASVAVGEYAAAWQHLSAARRHGFDSPQLSTTMGLAGLEVFAQQRKELRAIRNAERRQALEQEIQDTWLTPALAHLEDGREALQQRAVSGLPLRSRAESADYVAAFAALERGELDRARQAVEAALQKEPGLYEAEVLLGRIHLLRSRQLQSSGSDEEVLATFELARQALERAARLGRSDPRVYVEACALEVEATVYVLYNTELSIRPRLSAGDEACATALRLDEDDPQPWRLASELLMRRAEIGDRREANLEAAADLAREAIRRRPDNADSWRSLGHVFSVKADALQVRFRDASEALDQMIAAYSEAYRLAPRLASVSNALGNAYRMRAFSFYDRGADGREHSRRAIDAYQQAIESAPEYGYGANLALAYARMATYELERGFDAGPAIEIGLAVQIEDRQTHPHYNSGRLNLADLEQLRAIDAGRRGSGAWQLWDQAWNTCEETLTIDPESWLTGRRCGSTALIHRHAELYCGRSQLRDLTLMDEFFDEPEDKTGIVWLIKAALLRVKAIGLLRSGQNADSVLSQARQALITARDLEPAPGTVASELEWARLALADAYAGRHSQSDRRASLKLAKEAFKKVEQRRPERFEGRVGLIQTALLRAELEGARGDRHSSDRARAEELWQQLLSAAPGVTELKDLMAQSGVPLLVPAAPCPND